MENRILQHSRRDVALRHGSQKWLLNRKFNIVAGVNLALIFLVFVLFVLQNLP